MIDCQPSGPFASRLAIDLADPTCFGFLFGLDLSVRGRGGDGDQLGDWLILMNVVCRRPTTGDNTLGRSWPADKLKTMLMLR